MLLDFPSLSSLTITSKNEPSFVKEQYSIPSAIDGIKPKKKKRSTLPTWPLVQQLKLILSAIKSSQKQEQPPQKRHHARLLSHYGQLQRRQIGTGASATVLLTHQLQEDGKVVRVYAVKAFRKRKVRETDASFMKKLISEFCISSTLDHPNIVKTVDLVLDDKNRYCTVMEYVSHDKQPALLHEQAVVNQRIPWFIPFMCSAQGGICIHLLKRAAYLRKTKPMAISSNSSTGSPIFIVWAWHIVISSQKTYY